MMRMLTRWQLPALSGGNSPAFALIIIVMLLVPLILPIPLIPLILSLILFIPAILLNFVETAFVVLVIATVIVVTGIIVAVIGSASTVIWRVSVGTAVTIIWLIAVVFLRWPAPYHAIAGRRGKRSNASCHQHRDGLDQDE